MFSKTVAIFFTATLAALAVATPLPQAQSQCNTGPIQCCNAVQRTDTSTGRLIHSLLGVSISDITALVGVQCSPISAIGVGGNSCSSQPVCCSNNNFNGVVAFGCTPINVNL